MKLFEKVDKILNSPVPTVNDAKGKIIEKMPKTFPIHIRTNRQYEKEFKEMISDLAFEFVNSYLREIITISYYAVILENLDEDEEKWTYKYETYLEAATILGHVAFMCLSMSKHYFHNPYYTLVSLTIFPALEDNINEVNLGAAIYNAEKYIEKFKELVPEHFEEEYNLHKWAEFKEELKNETKTK